MITLFTGIVTYAGAIFSLLIIIGGALALRPLYAKLINQVHQEVITAQKEQITALKEQIATYEKRVHRMEQAFKGVQKAFERRGVTIEIDGDMITIIDMQRGRQRTIQIPINDEEKEDE